MIGYRVYPAGQSVRAGAWRDKQQQLRQCPADIGHCHADESASRVGRLGTCVGESQAAGTTAQEWHRIHRLVLDVLFTY